MSTRHRFRHVLFVCSGNYYRSRLAEIIFNHRAAAEKLDWRADSAGLIDVSSLSGLSEHTAAWLREHGLGDEAEDPRDPRSLTVEDLGKADLVVAMCRQEHQPMLEARFAGLGKSMLRSGKLRYWNIFDVPAKPPALLRLIGRGHRNPSQPPASGTEHTALAVECLIAEIRAGGPHAGRPAQA